MHRRVVYLDGWLPINAYVLSIGLWAGLPPSTIVPAVALEAAWRKNRPDAVAPLIDVYCLGSALTRLSTVCARMDFLRLLSNQVRLSWVTIKASFLRQPHSNVPKSTFDSLSVHGSAT